ncbi:MAG: indole-3-glycerol phosphate synthase TrpC [Zetaproteobacteria bacterium]|nr:MAG: indole-3-glycerol phosphate synthase TrpC [Zetaproteobacteria bacterium]
MSSILQEIAGYKRSHLRACKQRLGEAELLRRAEGYTPCDFRAALVQRAGAGKTAVIAEVKKASPSRGVIRADFDPVWIAERYQEAGAACLSVLTDQRYFQGSDDHLRAIRERVALPILRKEFIVDPYQVVEARALGADAILIIMAMLDDGPIAEIAAAAREMGLTILPEVHDEAELERALLLETTLVGINNRNLHTFATDLAVTERLLPRLPAGRTVVTESGIHSAADRRRMERLGVHCFLVGESLMRQADPGRALAALLGEGADADGGS